MTPLRIVLFIIAIIMGLGLLGVAIPHLWWIVGVLAVIVIAMYLAGQR